MATLYVFRHGQTTDNKEKRFSGWANPDLTDEGIKEAKNIGKQLEHKKITQGYSSTLLRSQHTLSLALMYHSEIPTISDIRLNERNYGTLTGKNKEDTQKEFPREYPLWHRSYDVAPPEGESIADVEKRVLSFLHDFLPTLNNSDEIALCVHGNSLRPIRRFFEKLSIEEMCSFEHTPGKIYTYTTSLMSK